MEYSLYRGLAFSLIRITGKGINPEIRQNFHSVPLKCFHKLLLQCIFGGGVVKIVSRATQCGRQEPRESTFFSDCQIRIETTIKREGENMSYIITRTMSLICKSSVIESQTIAINRHH